MKERTAVGELIEALASGQLTTEEAAVKAREIPWVIAKREEPRGSTAEDLLGAAETEDIPSAVPGSFDEVSVASVLGKISTEQYGMFYHAWCQAKGANPVPAGVAEKQPAGTQL